MKKIKRADYIANIGPYCWKCGELIEDEYLYYINGGDIDDQFMCCECYDKLIVNLDKMYKNKGE